MASTEVKKGWSGNTMYSISTPPLQLVAIVGIVVFLLWTSSYMNYKASMETATVNANLLILPLVLLLIALYGRLAVPVKNYYNYSNSEDGSSASPAGLAAMASLVLVLVYHRPYLIFVVAILFLYTYVLSA
ncbi:hypothetical protein PIB30_013976 [Stylosanthes scabra]|uniref:Uncharacterized protein n=1 Tax=Stylosanthes scabra TaxID=79078 RepID=A0ABU6X425_9FABA|nr:hypothetical protein [Stylosanthes scabra]